MDSQVGQCGLLQQPLVFGDKANHEVDVRPLGCFDTILLKFLVYFLSFMFGKVIMEACYSWAKNVKVWFLKS